MAQTYRLEGRLHLSAQHSRTKTLGIGLPCFRKFKNFLGNNLRRVIARLLEPGLFARYPISGAHGVYDLKPKAIHTYGETDALRNLCRLVGRSPRRQLASVRP